MTRSATCAPRAVPAALLVITAFAGARAQNQPSRSTEFRADVIAGRGTAGEIGGGVQIPLGYYVRLGVVGAAGVTWRDGEAPTSGRVDVVARYLLDPFREVDWAPSFGGGMSLLYVDGDTRPKPYLTVVIDLEGPRMRSGKLSPALQLGLGGGTRISIALRASRGPWR